DAVDLRCPVAATVGGPGGLARGKDRSVRLLPDHEVIGLANPKGSAGADGVVRIVRGDDARIRATKRHDRVAVGRKRRTRGRIFDGAKVGAWNDFVSSRAYPAEFDACAAP